MHIDKYNIWNYIRPWKNAKLSKTEEITHHLVSEDCIQSKDVIRLLEELYDTWNGDYAQKEIFIEVTFKDVER